MSEKKTKKTLIKIVLFILIIAVIVTGGYFTIRSSQMKNEVKYRIISIIEKTIDRGIYIGKIKNYSLKSLTLSDFKVFKDTALREEDLIFYAEEIILNYDLDLLSALKKEVSLSVGDITLTKPRMTLIRDTQGTFDFMKKFNLTLVSIFPIKGLIIEEGDLDYLDYRTTKENGLLTSVKHLNGYINLAELPKVEIDCTGERKEDDTPISLEGHFFTERVDYVLDFTFQDSEIAHFKNYFVKDEILTTKKGLFDADLRLTNDFGGIPGKVNWQGKIAVKDVDLCSNFLDDRKINQVNGSAVFNSEKISIESITGTYHNSPFSLEGDLTLGDEFKYSVKLNSNNLQLSDLAEEANQYLSLPEDFSLKGSSDLVIEVNGLKENFQISGKLSTQKGNIAGCDFLNLSVGFNVDPDRISLKTIKAEVEDGMINGAGEVSLSKKQPEYNFAFDFSRLDTQGDILKPFISNYIESSGLLSGNLNIKGVFHEGEETSLAAKIKVEDTELGNFLLQAEGSIARDNFLDLKLKVEDISLKELGKSFNYNEMEGQASLIGTVKGLPDNLEVEGIIETRQVSIAGATFNDLTGKVKYKDKKITLAGLTLENEKIHLNGEGEVNFSNIEKGMGISATLQITETDLAFLENFYHLNMPISGLINGEIELKGHWPKLTAKADFTFSDFYLENYYAESGNTTVVLTDNILKVENMMLKSGKNVLYAKGEINLEEKYPMDLRVNFLNQDIQTLLSNFVESNLLNKFKGKATGSIEITGMIASPDFYLASIIEDVRLEGLPFNSIDLQLEKIGSEVKINRLKLKQQKGELNAEGSVDFQPDNENMKINVTANNVDLKQLSNFFNLNDEFDEFEGLVNFTAMAEGKLDAPDISFSAQVKKARFAEFYFDFLNLEALYDQEILKIKQFVLNIEGNQIIGKGEIPYRFSLGNQNTPAPSLADLPLDFTLDMENTDLKFMQLFFKDDFKQVNGLTNLSVKLSGTLKNPILNGSIALSGGEVEFYKSIPKISNLNARIGLKDNLLEITDMNFQIDQFRLKTSGEITLKNLVPQDLHIKLWSNDQEITYKDFFKSQTDLDVEITGRFDDPCIRGTLILSQAELNWKENEETTFDMNKVLSELTDLKGEIDIKVEIADGFTAETKDFNLHLGGNITVDGELSSPKIKGELNVEQGYIAFLDRRFRVSNGKIIFPDSLEKELILNVKAKTKIDDIDILLHLGGTPSQLSITLDSSPALSENEIISLLMFNKNYTGLSEGELTEVLRDEMVNLLAQGLSLTFLNQIENQIASSLGLDEFDIETIFKKEENNDLGVNQGLTLAGLVLKIGKYFSENFYLNYSTPLYEAGLGTFEFEFKVEDDLILSTQIGSTGSQEEEFELKFELQYEF